MSGRLAGKKAVVTAAGQGIGRATAIAFADEGAVVWATDINEEALAALKHYCPDIQTRKLDVLKTKDVADLAAEIGALDVLFNCAGFVHHGTLLECEEKDWDFSFDLNIKSMYRTCRAFLPAMLGAGKAASLICRRLSPASKGAPNRFVYGSTKAAVIGFTKGIAVDFIRKGIRCNAICPWNRSIALAGSAHRGARRC